MSLRKPIYVRFGDDGDMVGPALYFRVTGNFMRMSNMPLRDTVEAVLNRGSETIVAKYSQHVWKTARDEAHTNYSAENVIVWFSDSEGATSKECGPFKELKTTDGAMYVDGKLFARLVEESQLWHHYETQTFWASVSFMSSEFQS